MLRFLQISLSPLRTSLSFPLQSLFPVMFLYLHGYYIFSAALSLGALTKIRIFFGKNHKYVILLVLISSAVYYFCIFSNIPRFLRNLITFSTPQSLPSSIRLSLWLFYFFLVSITIIIYLYFIIFNFNFVHST